MGREIFLCLNLANCRNAQTNYHLTSQQSVPFLLSALFRPLSPGLLHPKTNPANAFDLLQSRRCLRGNLCTGALSLPSLYALFSFSLFLRVASSTLVPRWSPAQNSPSSADYPGSTGATIAIVFHPRDVPLVQPFERNTKTIRVTPTAILKLCASPWTSSRDLRAAAIKFDV